MSDESNTPIVQHVPLAGYLVLLGLLGASLHISSTESISVFASLGFVILSLTYVVKGAYIARRRQQAIDGGLYFRRYRRSGKPPETAAEVQKETWKGTFYAIAYFVLAVIIAVA